VSPAFFRTQLERRAERGGRGCEESSNRWRSCHLGAPSIDYGTTDPIFRSIRTTNYRDLPYFSAFLSCAELAPE
jgi:hypothetical protein